MLALHTPPVRLSALAEVTPITDIANGCVTRRRCGGVLPSCSVTPEQQQGAWGMGGGTEEVGEESSLTVKGTAVGRASHHPRLQVPVPCFSSSQMVKAPDLASHHHMW